MGYRRDYDWGELPVGPPTSAELARLASRTGSVLILSYPTLAGEIPASWAEAKGMCRRLAAFRRSGRCVDACLQAHCGRHLKRALA